MITNTEATPSFIDWSPDWNRPFSMVTIWKTGVQPNREGGTQRSKQRNRPRLSLTYFYNFADTLTFSQRRARAIQQLGKAVVVPVWVQYGTASSFGTNSVTLNAAITSLKYKVGSWVYVTQGANACFRKITSVATPTINLSSSGADFFPVGFSWASFSAGARVYPCIVGSRSDNSFRFGSSRVDKKSELVEVEEL